MEGSDSNIRKLGNKNKQAKSRKIRCIQDFDNLNRSSLTSGGLNSEYVQRIKTKKKQKLSFLPKLGLCDELPNENFKLRIKYTSASEKVQDFKCSDLTVEQPLYLTQDKSQNVKEKFCSLPLRVCNETSKDNCNLNKKYKSISERVQDVQFSVNTVQPQNVTQDKFQSDFSSISSPDTDIEFKPIAKNKVINFYRQSILEDDTNRNRSNCLTELTGNITPDTYGNNQGIFDVSCPIEDSTLLELSTVGSELTKNNYHFQQSDRKQCHNEIVHSEFIQKELNKGSSKSYRKNCKRSIINLLTPSPQTLKSNDLDKSVHTPTPRKTSADLVLTETCKDNYKVSRSNTFTKDDKFCIDKNPLQINVVDNSTLRTTIRKKWTKSLGVSMIDNSGNLQLISAPSHDSLNSSQNIIGKSSSIKHVKILNHLPLVSSTPMSGYQNQNAFTVSPNIKKSENKSKKKTKMPNFAQIHQRAFEKLENIKEMTERKAARAKTLLSGQKPQIGMSNKLHSKTRKVLHYSPVVNMNLMTAKTNVVQPLKIIQATKAISKPMPQKIDFKAKSSIPVPKYIKMIRENKLPLKNKSFDKKCLEFRADMVSVKKTAFQEDHLKAFANKKRLMTESIENRRKVVQHVRTNRRFELLMKMRNK